MRDPQTMKADAMAFYDLMFNQCRPREAIERYAGASYSLTTEHGATGATKAAS